MYRFLVCKFADHTGVERRETGQTIYTAFRLDDKDKKILNASIDGLCVEDLARNIIDKMRERGIKNWEIKNHPINQQGDVKPLDTNEYGELYTTLSLAKL